MAFSEYNNAGGNGAGRGRADASIYLDRLDDWPAFRSLNVRLSGHLSRRLPFHRCRMANDRPLATFTFDDAPSSVSTYGASVLEAAGARGTFYISTALLGRSTEYWQLIDAEGVRELHVRGHEIGMHGHCHLPVGSRGSAAEFSDDIARNRAVLRAIDPGIEASNFAYPYGHVTLSRKMQLARRVRSSRGVAGGINSGLIDTQLLRVIPLEEKGPSLDEIAHLLDAAERVNGWAIFMIHDVASVPSPFGVTPEKLAAVLRLVTSRSFSVLTMNAALDAAQIRMDRKA
jgi:peptidoglycan/xylan/chitin deacetylase (PgdA/CDA1 family)